MGLMRSLLLWAARNPTLAERVPRLAFARRAVKRFMPGERLDDALDAAAELARAGIPVTFTHLGEAVTTVEQADAAAEHYENALRRIHRRGMSVELSVKLTHLGQDIDADLAAKHLESLTRLAREYGNWMFVDMEASPYVDRTLDAYRQVRAEHPNVGVCLQAYLHRTPADIADLLPLRPAIRLVKGAYREPPSVALQRSRDIDARFVELAAALVLGGGPDVRVVLGTHDIEVLRRVETIARAAGLPRDAYEIQMLYGIRSADLARLGEEGAKVSTLISYGEQWYRWYVRRLAERPANLWFVARNFWTRS